MRNHSNRKKATIIFLSIAVAIFLGFLYGRQGQLDFSLMSALTGKSNFRGKVRCSVTSDIGGGRHLSLKLAIPCQTRRQQLELLRKMPRLKHEWMMSLSRPEMEEVVRNRDFGTLRMELIRTLREHADKSVKTLYFEGFYTD